MKNFLLEHGFEGLIVVAIICLLGWLFPFGEIWATHEQEYKTLKVEYVNGSIGTLNLKVDKEATFLHSIIQRYILLSCKGTLSKFIWR